MLISSSDHPTSGHLSIGGPGAVELGSEAAEQLLLPVGKASKKAPCFSLMAALHVGSQEVGVAAASVTGCDSLQWIACDSCKPGRDAALHNFSWGRFWLSDRHRDASLFSLFHLFFQ